MQQIEETQVRSLGWEDSLEEGTATHSSILAWRLSWTEGPGRLQSIGLQRVRHDWSDLTHMHTAFWTVVLFLDGVLESPEESSKHTGTSLVVQWLRLHLPIKRMQVWSLVGNWEPTCLRANKRSPHPATTEPVNPCSTTGGAHTWLWEALSPQPEKVCMPHWRLRATKIKKKKKVLNKQMLDLTPH